MKVHSMQQGSELWHEHRAKYLNASDAPAMLGISPYKMRTQLLHERSTGIVPEVDASTQKRFDDGHRFEALARPLAQFIIGDDLSPVTGSEGRLSASFDGITFDGEVIFEHKTLSTKMVMQTGLTELELILPLDEQYRAQMEQQLMVSGATKCLFMASKWDQNDTLIVEVHAWYESDPDMRDRIRAGWDQFEKDLAAYVPAEIKEMPKAAVSIDLPALFVHAKGEITEHNMDAFGTALTTRLAEVRSIALLTDSDFSNAKDAAKKFRDTAKAIGLSKEAMLAQTETIGEAARKMDAWAKDLNATALQLEKDVEKEDLAKKSAMVRAANDAFTAHVAALEAETVPAKLNLSSPRFAEAIKGKRNYAAMQDAINTALAMAVIEADAVAKDIRAKLVWYREGFMAYPQLFPDFTSIIHKPLDDFKLLVTTRIDAHKEALAQQVADQVARTKAEDEAKAAPVEPVAKAVEAPIAAGPLDRRVGGDTAIYALFDPDGKLRRCGETLDIATNYLTSEMHAEFWNALFGEEAEKRVKVFEKHGWRVLQGTFTPNE